MGYVYHYIVNCNECKKRYHVARTSEVYNLVKDLPWQLSKEAKKHREEEKRPSLLSTQLIIQQRRMSYYKNGWNILYSLRTR